MQLVARPRFVPDDVPTLSGLPVLGNLLEFRANRLKLQQRASEAGPITRFDLMGLPLFSVSDADLAHEILVTHADAFTKGETTARFLGPLLGEGLLTAEGELHRQHRRLLAPAFAPKRLAAYGDAMLAEAETTLATWQHGAEIQVGPEMMGLTLAIAGRTLFGADVRGEARQVDVALTMAMEAVQTGIISPIQAPYHVPLPRHRKLRRAVAMLDEVVFRLIAAGRASGVDRGDVLSMLLLTRDDDGHGLSDQQVRDEVMTMILAGHETTANALTWTFVELGRHPQVRAQLEAELDRVLAGRRPSVEDLPHLPWSLAVIEEALRLHPPAWITSREALRDVTIGGRAFAAKTIFTIHIRGLHRRADYYPDPTAFRPERMLPAEKKLRPRGRYLPFGAGPRVCIGAHFALLEAHLLLATIAGRAQLVPTTTAPVVPEPLLTLRPRGDVPMRVRRRDRPRSSA